MRDLDASAYERLWRTNVLAPQQLIRAALPQLSPGAVILNISSDAGAEHYEQWGGYGSTKAALDHQTLTWAAEEPQFTWYSVDPGDLRTAMHQAAFPGEDISDRPEPETVAPTHRRPDQLRAAQRALPGGRPGGPYTRQRRCGVSTLTLPTEPTTRFAPPDDTTATAPPEQRGLRRDGVRLLVAGESGIRHTRFAQLGDHLRAGDVLVVNTSATLPGQLDGRRGGDPIVVHVANRLADGTRVVELRIVSERRRPGAGRPSRVSASTCPPGPRWSCCRRTRIPAPRRPGTATGSGGLRCTRPSG